MEKKGFSERSKIDALIISIHVSLSLISSVASLADAVHVILKEVSLGR